MKLTPKHLLTPLPQRGVALCCGIGGGLLIIAAAVTAFTGDGGASLLFLLLGVVGLAGSTGRNPR